MNDREIVRSVICKTCRSKDKCGDDSMGYDACDTFNRCYPFVIRAYKMGRDSVSLPAPAEKEGACPEK